MAMVKRQLQASGEAKAAKNLRAAGEVNNAVLCILERSDQHFILYFGERYIRQ